MTSISHPFEPVAEAAQRAVVIDGEFVRSKGGESPVTDKATGEVLGDAATATAAEVERAVAGAVAAQRDWYAIPAASGPRSCDAAGTVLQREAARFKDVLIREGGATGPRADGEIAASVIEFYQTTELATTPLGEIIPSGHLGGVGEFRADEVGGFLTASGSTSSATVSAIRRPCSMSR
jgi:benzaldehyde dehydrogenase (NAD)